MEIMEGNSGWEMMGTQREATGHQSERWRLGPRGEAWRIVQVLFAGSELGWVRAGGEEPGRPWGSHSAHTESTKLGKQRGVDSRGNLDLPQESRSGDWNAPVSPRLVRLGHSSGTALDGVAEVPGGDMLAEARAAVC